MSEQLDRIEALLISVSQQQTQNTEVIHRLDQRVEQLDHKVDRLEQNLEQTRQELKREIERQVNAASQMTIDLGDQMRRWADRTEDFKLEVRQFIVEMQHMKGLMQAHMERTDRVLDYLMRKLPPEVA